MNVRWSWPFNFWNQHQLTVSNTDSTNTASTWRFLPLCETVF